MPSVPNCPPMYMDLVYIPNHCNAKNVDAEFFKRVRSSYYVVSGNDQATQEPSKAVLNSLLEGKAQWGNNMQVLALNYIQVCFLLQNHTFLSSYRQGYTKKR